mmetsp:Transcript_12316/g.37878  ORF Transcript_12316/g.37878 Transcript_12316/m.37878 type:complete len:210 (-) Transcript_12316:668-1297(-)
MNVATRIADFVGSASVVAAPHVARWIARAASVSASWYVRPAPQRRAPASATRSFAICANVPRRVVRTRASTPRLRRAAVAQICCGPKGCLFGSVAPWRDQFRVVAVGFQSLQRRRPQLTRQPNLLESVQEPSPRRRARQLITAPRTSRWATDRDPVVGSSHETADRNGLSCPTGRSFVLSRGSASAHGSARARLTQRTGTTGSKGGGQA